MNQGHMIIIRRYKPDDEAYRRQLTFAEEDRHRFTTAAWSGGYRWFKSANVTPIEYYRRLDSAGATKRGGITADALAWVVYPTISRQNAKRAPLP
jgi:hypothetical protein